MRVCVCVWISIPSQLQIPLQNSHLPLSLLPGFVDDARGHPPQLSASSPAHTQSESTRGTGPFSISLGVCIARIFMEHRKERSGGGHGTKKGDERWWRLRVARSLEKFPRSTRSAERCPESPPHPPDRQRLGVNPSIHLTSTQQQQQHSSCSSSSHFAMMIHQYSPLEAPTISKSDVKTPSNSRHSNGARMTRPASMRAMVHRSTSANAALSSSTTEDSVTMLTTPTPPRSKRMRRFKSYSESGALLEHIVPPPRTRPFSAGDIEDLRRVTISGVSKNSKGTWMFKVDVGSDEWNTYVIRRRFTDFKELHDGLQGYDSSRVLPELPHHGIYSMFQIFVAPEKALNQRAERLQELLECITNHPVLCGAAAFKKFIGKNPQSLELGYVSLSCYEAPTSENQLRLSASESSFVYERRLSN